MKIIVFDLDETLGYFTQIGILWYSLNKYFNLNNIDINYIYNNNNNNNIFVSILDLYPEFIRPLIIKILLYLKNIKKKRICNKVLLYTNNRGPIDWVDYIIYYFESKIKYNLFDNIIKAFKIDNKIININRHYKYKCLNDLIRCANIPNNTTLCYVDDTYYSKMADDKITYLLVNPYVYQLSVSEIISRFIHNFNNLNNIDIINIHNMTTYINNSFNKHTFDNTVSQIPRFNNYNSESIIIYNYIQKFFQNNNKNTIKKNKKYNTKTKTRKK